MEHCSFIGTMYSLYIVHCTMFIVQQVLFMKYLNILTMFNHLLTNFDPFTFESYYHSKIPIFFNFLWIDEVRAWMPSINDRYCDCNYYKLHQKHFYCIKMSVQGDINTKIYCYIHEVITAEGKTR